MITQERHAGILARLKEKNFVEVKELAERFNVSEETIRRDLNTLEDLGQLRRVRGGAAMCEEDHSAQCTDGTAVNSPAAGNAAPKPVEVGIAQPTLPLKGNQTLPELAWFSPTRPPFRLQGLAFYETDGIYRRMPLNPPQPLPAGVESNSWVPSGGQIHFSANLSKLYVRVKLRKPPTPIYNTTPLAAAGMDVYASDGDGHYSFAGVARFDPKLDCYEAPLMSLREKMKLDLIIHMPMNSCVESVLIGIDRDEKPLAPQPLASDKRIVVYGGSIMHGFCASRPGMVSTNILSRRLNREVINVGFNGSAKCEDEAALSVRMIENAEVFIMSPEGNCPSVEWLREHMTSFIKLYREANPDTKIVVMSYMREGRERFDKYALSLRLAKKQCEIEIVKEFNDAGDKNVYFWDGEEVSSGDEDIMFGAYSAGDDCTVDTQHKSDLGFWLMANGICRRLESQFGIK